MEGSEMEQHVMRSGDWGFPMSEELAEAIDAFADAVESDGESVPYPLSAEDYLMDIWQLSRDLPEKDEAILRAYYWQDE